MRTRLQIQRVDPWSLFKVAFLLYAAVGLAVGIFYALILLIAGSMGTLLSDEFSDVPGIGFLGGALGLIAIPFVAGFYGLMGSVFVTIAGLLYNLAAKITGGLSFDTDVQVAPDPTADPAGETPPPGI